MSESYGAYTAAHIYAVLQCDVELKTVQHRTSSHLLFYPMGLAVTVAW